LNKSDRDEDEAMTPGEIITLIVCGGWMAFWFVIIIKANVEYWRMPREWRRDITHDLYW
jgi:hypothetical protein